MRRLVFASVLLVLVLSSCTPKKNTQAPQIITASADVGGSLPGTVPVDGAARVTCLDVTGADPEHNPPSCMISAPGYSGSLSKGSTIQTNGAGTVKLSCSGRTPLRCSARVE